MGYKEDIAAAKLQIENVTNDKIIDVTLRIHATLVSNPPKGTPVDFGWASANWFINVGSPSTANTGNLPKNRPSAVAGREAQQAATVARFVSGYNWLSSGGANAVVHISNNVPYINRLNTGWSNQAPAGFVDDAVQEAVVWGNNQGVTKI